MLSEHIEIANKTSRANGMIGKNALVPKFVKQIVSKDQTILDFGAGKHAMHTQELRSKGYNITAYDFGNNVTELHDPNALNKKYDVVFASNVLNTLSTVEDIEQTVSQMINCVEEDGILIVNIPASPRKLQEVPEDSHNSVWNCLHKEFCRINRIGGTAKAPVYHATNVLPEL